MSSKIFDAVIAALEKTKVSPNTLSFEGQSLKLNSEEDAKVIVDGILNCSDLESLNLEGNTLGVDAAKAISKALETQRNFKRALWKDLFTGRMKTEIPLALQHLGDGLVRAGARLVELDLSDNAFGPIGVEGLASLLRSSSCYALEELKLNNNGLGITGGKLLAKALMDCYSCSTFQGKALSLKVFVAGRNRLENDGAKALAEVFKTIGTLEEIVMPQNGIYHEGIKALSESFVQNKNLQVLDILKSNLNQPRSLTPPLEGIQQQYGMNTNLLKKVVEFWKTKYNWREREKYLNKFPQFKTKIQGLAIHFIHVKPTVTDGKEVIPLLLMHGWPGSVREFYELIPLLTTPQKNYNFVFEVIVPSLPGYGFSDASAKPGLDAGQIGVIFKNLMKRLSFDKFYIQGGDWGSFIGQLMAAFYPEQVLGLHSNLCIPQAPLSLFQMLIDSICPASIVGEKFQHKIYPLSTMSNILMETGYLHIQASKPDTIGVALGDSPIGLAAYLLEKFSSWTDLEWKNREDGGLELKFKYTDLLDNVMIYWITGSITTSMRLYSEAFYKETAHSVWGRIPIQVPSACARFAHELVYFSNAMLKHSFKNLVQVSDIPKGGHFAAFEEPQLMANDIWSAVEKFRKVQNQAVIK